MLSIRKERIDQTEGDSWILVTDVLTLLVGEEHVSREATLWRVRVCDGVSRVAIDHVEEEDEPFFFFSVRPLVALLVVFSLGMMKDCDESNGSIDCQLNERLMNDEDCDSERVGDGVERWWKLLVEKF
jgi:hypothetical protein